MPAPAADDSIWDSVRRFAEHSHSDQARLEHLHFVAFDGRTLRLSVDDDTDGRLARFLTKQAGQIAELVKRATAREVRVEVEWTGTDAPVTPAADDRRERARSLRQWPRPSSSSMRRSWMSRRVRSEK